jgi:hypothetical protein
VSTLLGAVLPVVSFLRIELSLRVRAADDNAARRSHFAASVSRLYFDRWIARIARKTLLDKGFRRSAWIAGGRSERKFFDN